MIELRYVERGATVNGDNVLVRVLQYRLFDQEMEFYSGPSGDPKTGWDRRWSEWRDVPTVSDDGDNSP